jgi:hypothetical protein
MLATAVVAAALGALEPVPEATAQLCSQHNSLMCGQEASQCPEGFGCEPETCSIQMPCFWYAPFWTCMDCQQYAFWFCVCGSSGKYAAYSGCQHTACYIDQALNSPLKRPMPGGNHDPVADLLDGSRHVAACFGVGRPVDKAWSR